MKGSLLLYNLKLNCLIFSTSLNSSLTLFIRTYTVNYRNALDRLRVRMNIILFLQGTRKEVARCVNVLCQNGAHDVKNHRWFRNIVWDEVVAKQTEVSWAYSIY